MIDYKENAKLRGSVDLKLIGPNGEIKESRYIPNLVVQAGKSFIATRMLGSNNTSNVANVSAVASTVSITSCMTHMAVGTSTTTASVTDPTLLGEVNTSAAVTSVFRPNIQSQYTTTGVVTYVATFTANNPQQASTANTTAITEAGIFNNAAYTSGTMLCRTTFNVVNKGNDDTLQITWTITVS